VRGQCFSKILCDPNVTPHLKFNQEKISSFSQGFARVKKKQKPDYCMVLEKIRAIFSKEPLQIEKEEDIPEKFREEKQSELGELDEKAEELRKDVIDAVESLEGDLEDLRDFEDDRAVIEDNVSNIVGDRLRILEDFFGPEDIEEFHSELEKVLEEFNELGRKEKAVLDEANLQKEFSDSLKSLTELYEDLDRFIEEDYSLKKKLEELEEKTDRLEELEDEKSGLKEEIKSIEPESIEERLEEKKREITELEESEIAQEHRDLNERLDELGKEIEGFEKQVSKALSRSGRGLKKMLHEKKIHAEREQLKILEDIRDGKSDKLMDRDPEKVSEAAESAEESVKGDFLGKKTRRKLLEGLEKLQKLPEIAQKIEQKEDKIESLEDEIQGHEFQDRMEELRRQKEELERKLSEEEERKNELKEELEGLEEKEDEIRNEILELANEGLERGIEKGKTENS
jgi:chromosome segregation ATPase